MSAMKQWVRKVATGLAAFLLACFQFLGTVDLSGMAPYGYGYMWTHHGMRVLMNEEHMARLEGDVHEDQLRRTATRERESSVPEKKSVS